MSEKKLYEELKYRNRMENIDKYNGCDIIIIRYKIIYKRRFRLWRLKGEMLL